MRLRLGFLILVIASAFSAERLIDFADYLRNNPNRVLIQIERPHYLTGQALADWPKSRLLADLPPRETSKTLFALQFATSPSSILLGSIHDHAAHPKDLRDGLPLVLVSVKPQDLARLLETLAEQQIKTREQVITEDIRILFPEEEL